MDQIIAAMIKQYQNHNKSQDNHSVDKERYNEGIINDIYDESNKSLKHIKIENVINTDIEEHEKNIVS